MTTLKIRGGRVIDPVHNVDEVRDLWIGDGMVIEPPADPDAPADRAIDARGYVVMAGGVDMHCHIAGSKVNAARAFRPEDRSGYLHRAPGLRSGTKGSVPTSFATGYQYAGLGYTSAVDAAISPFGARHAHHEFRDTPALDKAMLILMGNNHYVMDRIREGDRDRVRHYLAWLLDATGGYGVKIVNPGGVERWKEGRGNVSALDDEVDGFGVTPRQILVELALAADDLALPHPVHVHGLNLGLPGNAATTMETFRAIDGHRAHFAHIQFHSYGGKADRPSSISSRVEALADHFNAHPGLTADVGQVMFGETTSMTADGAVGQFLHDLTGKKWLSQDVERETGCGVVPIRYDDTNAVHALQWAIGLEWFLRVEDPWRIALSTDHPNGGSFLAYPQLISLLMSKNHRDEVLKGLPDKTRARSGLGDLSREYSLGEIATITRAAPARILGMDRKGHLGVGADGDVTIYNPSPDYERMFAMPRYVIKSGRVVIDDGALRPPPEGVTLRTSPGYDPAIRDEIAEWFDALATIRFRNFEGAGDP